MRSKYEFILMKNCIKPVIFYIILTILGAQPMLFAGDFYNQHNNEQIFIGDKTIIIKSELSPPNTYDAQRKEAYRILRPYFSPKLQKAVVVWQKDIFTDGKKASIAGVYIKGYLNHRIRKSKFLSYFRLEPVYKIKIRKNNVERIVPAAISDDVIRKATALRDKADIYRLNYKYDSALRMYNQVLDLNPFDTVSLFWLAEIYRSQKDYDKAKEYYIKVLSIDPDFQSADDALYELKNN